MELGDGILDAVVRAYQAASYPLLVQMMAPAQALLVTLFTIDFVWDLTAWTLADVPGLFARALHRFLVFLILWGALLLAPFWLPELVEGFSQLAQSATGLPGLSPSAILGLGFSLFFRLTLAWEAVVDWGLPTGNLRAATALGLLLAFTLVAYQLMRLLVEVALAIGGLAVFLGFAGSRRTFALADGYLRYVVHLGVRIFVCYLLVAVGQNFGALWEQQLSAALITDLFIDPRALLSIPIASVLWALLVLSLPSTIATRIADGLSFAHPASVGAGHA